LETQLSHFDDQIATAAKFVVELDLPPLPSSSRSSEGGLSDKLKPITETQSLAVGHRVVSFLGGLPSRHREVVANTFLLAQLVADRRVPAQQGMDQWYLAFFEALRGLGWLIQEQRFAEYSKQGAGVEIHEAILNIAATLLGSASAGYQVVKSTLEGLHKLSEKDWITVFRKNDHESSGDIFQVAVASPNQDGDISIALMAFLLQAKSTRVRVLFFKWDHAVVALRHATATVVYTNAVSAGVRELVANKVKSYAADYVTSLEI
jgi:hypothetical protein